MVFQWLLTLQPEKLLQERGDPRLEMGLQLADGRQLRDFIFGISNIKPVSLEIWVHAQAVQGPAGVSLLVGMGTHEKAEGAKEIGIQSPHANYM